MIAPLSESFEVLLWAARRSTGRNESQPPPATENLDWDAVVQCAYKNTVIPLLAGVLKDDPSFPLTIRRDFDKRFMQKAGQNAILAREISALVEEFRTNRIDSLAYKGPALAILAYGNLSLRNPSYDIDLLLHASDIPRAKQLIIARGYRLTPSPEDEQHFLQYRYHLHFQRESPETQVELHWALTPAYWSFPIDYWKRTYEVTIGGKKLPTLDPECALLALCAHGAKEGWPRLSQILDVSQIIRAHPELDWKWVMNEAHRIRRERVLRLGLALAVWIGTSLPPEVSTYCSADPDVDDLVLEIAERLKSEEPRTGVNFHRYALRVWNRPADRINYLAYTLLLLPARLQTLAAPSEEDRNFLDLPGYLSFVYILIRPVRVIFSKGIRYAFWTFIRNI